MVETVLARVPLRWVVRAAVRSCGPAPITEVASASISAWSMKPSIIRIISPGIGGLEPLTELEQGRLVQGHRVSPVL